MALRHPDPFDRLPDPRMDRGGRLPPLPSTQYARTRVVADEDVSRLNTHRYRAEWCCTETRVIVGTTFASTVETTEFNARAAVAWCHIMIDRMNDVHRALLELRRDMGDEWVRASVELLATGIGNRAIHDAGRVVILDARSRAYRAMFDNLAMMAPPPQLVAYSEVGDPASFGGRSIDDIRAVRDGVVGRPTRDDPLAQRGNPGDRIVFRRDAFEEYRARIPGIEYFATGAEQQRSAVQEAAALSRARDTLVSCLNPAQLDQFNATGEFDVVLAEGAGWAAGRYRIRQRRTYTVLHVESGDEFCAVIEDNACPVYDQMLAMKLLLEIEPARLFATANRSPSGGAIAALMRHELMRRPAVLIDYQQLWSALIDRGLANMPSEG